MISTCDIIIGRLNVGEDFTLSYTNNVNAGTAYEGKSYRKEGP